MVFPDRLCGLGREADTVNDRAVAPGFADAITVHVADAHVGDHLRRRHGDDFGIGERIDTVGRQPVINPHRVGAGRKGLRKGVFALFLVHQRFQSRTVLDALFVELLRQRDGLAVVVEVHQDGHVFFRPADAHLHAVDQAVEHMRCIEFAVDQLVAHRGPRGFLGRNDFDAVFLVELHDVGHDHAGAVSQRYEPDLHFLLFGRIGTSGPGHAADRIRNEAHDRRPRQQAAASQKFAPFAVGIGCNLGLNAGVDLIVCSVAHDSLL